MLQVSLRGLRLESGQTGEPGAAAEQEGVHAGEVPCVGRRLELADLVVLQRVRG